MAGTNMRRIPIRTAIAAMAVALAFGAPNAYADEIIYTFSSASMTVGGNVETLGGTFTFDTSTDEVSAVNFTLSGPASSPTNPDTFTNLANTTLFTNDAFGFEGVDDTTTNGFAINFANSLADDADDLITLSDTSSNPCGCTGYILGATAVTGSADPVPEPGSLALLCSGLVGLGFFLRRERKLI